MTVQIGAGELNVTQVVAVARNAEPVAVTDSLMTRFSRTREHIETNWMRDDAPLIYSLNTGVGAFKGRRVEIEDIAQYQINSILAHATGVGENLPIDVCRATMLLRLNAFARDHSGVSPHVAERLADFLNLDLTPVVPAKGSVGASGDLAPLAHVAGALCGFEHAQVIYKGEVLSATEGMRQAGLEPTLTLAAKDASALLNGSTVSLALAALAWWDARGIAVHADLGLALSLEAMRAEKDAFRPELHAARPHPGQQLVARNVMKVVTDSKRMSVEAREVVFPGEARVAGQQATPRVQDVYSLRCAPQVHGPVRDALDYCAVIIAREINSATDNPLIIDVEGERRGVSGGHFHGQYIAQVMDLLSIVMTDLGSIAERRIARLIDPNLSHGLPGNLATGKPGLNTGYSTVQCSMSALVMESRTLSTPGSVDSIPGKSNAEDHVSNSTWCARKASTIVENTRTIVASEILVAAQALSLVDSVAEDFPIARVSRRLVDTVREVVPARVHGDVWFAADIEAAVALVKRGELLCACETLTGPLE